MLFDSPEITAILSKYANEPDFAVPEVVFLARSPDLMGERLLIEQVMLSLPASVRKVWKSRFINTNHSPHKSTWFQIMLADWLAQTGSTNPEPTILGNNPDFLVTAGDLNIVVEAKAILKTDDMRHQEIWKNEVQWLLNDISAPSYAVYIKRLKLQSRIDVTKFLDTVIYWLQTNSKSCFHFEDNRGNHVALETIWEREHGGVATIGPSGSFWLNPQKFHRPLRKKAGQHKAIRGSEYPYVIALYLEDKIYSAEEIAEAWFGRLSAIVDINTGTVVDQRIDRSGIHFYGSKIRHRSVTGTLVFHDVFDDRKKSRMLQAWYIQNPYANKPIDPWIFPVSARFVVQNQNNRNYEMEWK